MASYMSEKDIVLQEALDLIDQWEKFSKIENNEELLKEMKIMIAKIKELRIAIQKFRHEDRLRDALERLNDILNNIAIKEHHVNNLAPIPEKDEQSNSASQVDRPVNQ